MKTIKIVYMPPNVHQCYSCLIKVHLDQVAVKKQLYFKLQKNTVKQLYFKLQNLIPQLFDQRYDKNIRWEERVSYHSSWYNSLYSQDLKWCSKNYNKYFFFKHAIFDSGSELTEDTKDKDIPLVSLFQELHKRGFSWNSDWWRCLYEYRQQFINFNRSNNNWNYSRCFGSEEWARSRSK